jgi:hypothetical protein
MNKEIVVQLALFSMATMRVALMKIDDKLTIPHTIWSGNSDSDVLFLLSEMKAPTAWMPLSSRKVTFYDHDYLHLVYCNYVDDQFTLPEDYEWREVNSVDSRMSEYDFNILRDVIRIL